MSVYAPATAPSGTNDKDLHMSIKAGLRHLMALLVFSFTPVSSATMCLVASFVSSDKSCPVSLALGLYVSDHSAGQMLQA